MTQEFWQDLRKTNEIGFNQQQPNNFLIQYFNQLQLQCGFRQPSTATFYPLIKISIIWKALSHLLIFLI
jgi:hypothetical protein